MYKKISYSVLYNLVNAGFPLLTLPFVFRAITAEDYGLVVFSNVMYQAFFSLFFLSLTSFSIREYIRDKEGSFKIVYSLQVLFCILSFILYIAISFVFEYIFDVVNEYIYYFSITLLFSFLYSDWIMLSEQDYKKLLVRNILLKLILLIGVIAFVNGHDDKEIYVALISSNYILSFIVSYFYARKYYFSFLSFNYKSIKKYLKKCKYFIYSASVGTCYQYVDQIIIALLLNSASLAYLNILKQIISLLSIIPLTYCRFFQPKTISIYRSKENIIRFHIEGLKKYTYLLLSISCLFLIFGPIFYSVFLGKNFNLSYLSMILCNLVFLASSYSVYVDTQHSVPMERENVTFWGNIVVAVIYLPLILFLSKDYGYNGVIASLFFSEALSLTMILIYYFKSRKDG